MRPAPLIALCLLLSSCAPSPSGPGWGADPSATGQPYPFTPASMRIFPLTRLDLDAAGKPMIICHIEFRDAWGDSVKGAGRLQVSMAGSVTAAGGPRQDLAPLNWDIDLADLERNLKLYDRATRTYRIQLVDLPPIVSAAAGPPSPDTTWRIALRATLSSTADGPPTLQDEYVLQP